MDVFNPVEVIPEFTADFATKKGERVDYAIKKDGNIIALIEISNVTLIFLQHIMLNYD